MSLSTGPADAALDPEEADQHQEGSRVPGHLRAEDLSLKCNVHQWILILGVLKESSLFFRIYIIYRHLRDGCIQ